MCLWNSPVTRYRLTNFATDEMFTIIGFTGQINKYLIAACDRIAYGFDARTMFVQKTSQNIASFEASIRH